MSDFNINIWLEDKISHLKLLKRTSDESFIRTCDETFQTVLQLLHEASLEFISFNLLDECVVICLKKSDVVLREYQIRQYASALFLSYLYERTYFDLTLLQRLLCHFNYFNVNTKLSLHFWEPIGDFISCYLRQNNDYICCLLFQVINTWSKKVIIQQERSSIILNSLVRLSNNIECDFNKLMTIALSNQCFVLAHIWSVTKILLENNCLSEYFNVIEKDIQNNTRADSLVVSSLINLLSYGSDLVDYFMSFEIIENNNFIFLVYINSYCKLLMSLFENKVALKIVNIGIFKCYAVNSIKKLYKLLNKNSFNNSEVHQDTVYILNKLSEF